MRACVGVIGCGCNRFSLFYVYGVYGQDCLLERRQIDCFVFQLENVFETKY